LTESEALFILSTQVYEQAPLLFGFTKKPKQVAGNVNKKDLFRNKFVLTEWKVLFVHFILTLFIQFREQNRVTPSLLLRQ
jgi:hypothetical protein